MTGVKSLIRVNYDATDKEIYLFRTIQFLHMHNFAPHYIATATRILLYIVCFYYLFIVPPIPPESRQPFNILALSRFRQTVVRVHSFPGWRSVPKCFPELLLFPGRGRENCLLRPAAAELRPELQTNLREDYAKISQSWRRPLKCLLTLSYLRHYFNRSKDTMLNRQHNIERRREIWMPMQRS